MILVNKVVDALVAVIKDAQLLLAERDFNGLDHAHLTEAIDRLKGAHNLLIIEPLRPALPEVFIKVVPPLPGAPIAALKNDIGPRIENVPSQRSTATVVVAPAKPHLMPTPHATPVATPSTPAAHVAPFTPVMHKPTPASPSEFGKPTPFVSPSADPDPDPCADKDEKK